MPHFVTHLEAAIDGTELPHDRVQTMHEGRPLWVRYDLAAIGQTVRRAEIAAREPTLWRYRELLPLPDMADPVSLGEGSCRERLGRSGLRLERSGASGQDECV